MTIKQYLKMPKIQLIIAFLVLTTTIALHKNPLFTLVHIGTAVFFTTAADLLLLRLRKIPHFFPSAAIVAGFIIGFLASPNLKVYHILLICIIAMLSKNFVRLQNKHIFNPAALGLFIYGLLFMEPISWWGVSFQKLSLSSPILFFSFFAIIATGYVSFIRVKKYRSISTFLLVYSLLNGILHSSSNPLNLSNFLDPTVLFFALVMLPEPMTSPNTAKNQVYYGMLVAILSIVVAYNSILTKVLPDNLIAALLIGNLVFFKRR